MWSTTSGWTPTSTKRSKVKDGSGVEVRTDSGGDSVGLFATRAFKAGSTVVLESPLIWYSDAEEGERVCSWCLDPIEEPGDAVYATQMVAPRACGSGCEVGWCSYICQRQDEAMHARICGLLAAGRSVGLDVDAINLLQLVVRIMEVKRWGTVGQHLALGRQRTAGVVLTAEDSARCTAVGNILRLYAGGAVQHPQDRSVQQTKRRRITMLGHLKNVCINLEDAEVEDILKADKANSFAFLLPRAPGDAAPEARGFGVFPRMALANHSCRPTRKTKQPMTVRGPGGRVIPIVSERGRYDCTAHLALRFRAIVDIAPGVEIKQSYVELGWPSSLDGSMGNIETADLNEDEVNEMLDFEEGGQEDLAALMADFVPRGAYLLQEYGFACKCDRCLIEAEHSPDDAAWQKHYEWMTRHLCSQESCSGTRTPCNNPQCVGDAAHLECHLCGDTVSEVEVQAIVHALDYHDVDEPTEEGVDDDDEEVD
eukprot:gene14368-26144_t